MLSAMDDAIGAVLARLRAHGLEENTLIFFLSDNGGPPGTGSSNSPLRGYKVQTWEGGIRVPFIVQWKGVLPAGKVYDRPVIQLDILPPALASAGVNVRSEWKLDGVDLLPYLTGQKSGPPHDALFGRLGEQMAIRMGDWKLVKAPHEAMPELARGRGEADTMGAQLFNLSADIGEKTTSRRGSRRESRSSKPRGGSGMLRSSDPAGLRSALSTRHGRILANCLGSSGMPVELWLGSSARSDIRFGPGCSKT